MASTVTRRNPNILTATRRNVVELGRYRVQVGWSVAMGADPETVAIATYNVLGATLANGGIIEPRDPLTPTLTRNFDRIRAANVAAVRAANRGDDPTIELEALAATLEDELKQSIEDIGPPNKPSTEDSKGFNDPLIGAGSDGGRIYDQAAARVLKR